MKKVTIKDIAASLGVSTTLVSFALSGGAKKYRVSEEMVRKIRAKAIEMDYHPNNAAQSLRSGRNNTIGVILSDISNRFFADIARCIEDEASKNGITVLFGSTDEKTERLSSLIKVFLSKGIDGLIIVPCEGSEKVIEELVESRFPLVLLDRTFENLNVSSVTLNNIKATSIAVNELVSKGFRKIAFISYETGLTNILDREMGYVKAMTRAGLSEYTYVRKIDYSDKRANLAKILPDIFTDGQEAVIFSTNRLAIESLIILRQMGKSIPEDLAVIGFDGSETFAFELYGTGISYVKQPISQFGSVAFSQLQSLIAGDSNDVCMNLELNPELVVKESSENKH